MFRRIAGFELRYQLGSAVFWVAFGIFFLLTFGATTIPQITIGDKGSTHVNAPCSIIQILGVMSLFAIFILTAFVANVVVRDDETGFGSIVRSTPIRKFDYLFGRFSGAFLAGMIAFLSVPLGVLIGSFMPWLDPVKLGPFRPEDYLYAYFLIATPTLLVMASIFFALATVTRSMLATYLGVVAFLICYLVLTALFSKPQFDHIVGLIEPSGLGAIAEATKYWTAYERNTSLPPLSGIVIENRAIWFGFSFVMLALSWWLMRFETRGARAGGTGGETEALSAAPPHHPLPQPHFDAGARLLQAWMWTRFEMGQLVKSPAYFVLLALGLLNGGGAMWFADEVSDYKIFPVTRVMIESLIDAFAIIPLIIAIYYAGELVWRERERRTHEIFESTPVPDWVFVIPKIAAIVLVLVSTFLVSVVAGVLVQAFKGYHGYEITHYLLRYVAPETVRAILLAVLAIFVQAVSPHKYVGWGLMALYLVATITLSNIGFENHLYLYGTAGSIPLSDMNGEGQFWIGPSWFDLYWCGVALILSVLAYALWRRGSETRFRPRLARLPSRLGGMAGALAVTGLLIAIGAGSYIYYNIKVLNTYRTTIEEDEYKADYEKAFLKFENVPQPHVTQVLLDVALYPHDIRAVINGSYLLENHTNGPLAHIHLRWIPDLKMRALSVDGAHLEQRFGRFNYVIYAFDGPMQPGEKRSLRFTAVYEQRGFRNRDNDHHIVDNGTFLNNFDIAPIVGMDRDMLLDDPVKRRRYGLPSELRPPKLEDDRARAYNYLGHGADWVTSDITVSTVADQTPIAPGYMVSERVRAGRRTVRFRSDAPILDFFSVQSAAYSVKRDRWHDVDLAVYYDPHHPYDVDRMIAAMKASFDVYTKAFTPFRFHQMRILEFPAYDSFAQSFANTVPYSESLGFIQNWDAIKDDPDKIDMVTFVTAHELGHQWWAHQIIGADMQGATMLSETFAQYSAMLVMEHLYGPEHVRKFLKWSLDSYLRKRGNQERDELPLERVENQDYIHYWKGAVVMYRLKETVGERVVNRSLRRLLAQYAFKSAPYASSKDFIKILREEAGPKYDSLITDLFQRITLYDLKADRASCTKRPDGRYDVALDVDAKKFYADGNGRETATPMKEDVFAGLFLSEPGKAGFDSSKVLYYARQPVITGKQTLHFIVNGRPRFAGIDPYNIWIDRNSEDNIVAVAGP
ncbi:MAG TPA: M1 family aminopeptidase [Rhizomicrobium sp.]|jgi:aminopeptidase N|nr:M1 family aminopeptidase [Rhizomicrobium sp.]